jgi:hypothetical protein
MKKYIVTLIFLLLIYTLPISAAVSGYTINDKNLCISVSDNADFSELEHCQSFINAKINNPSSRKVEMSETDPRGVNITKGPLFIENNYYGDLYGWAYSAYNTLNRTASDFNSPIYDSDCRFSDTSLDGVGAIVSYDINSTDSYLAYYAGASQPQVYRFASYAACLTYKEKATSSAYVYESSTDLVIKQNNNATTTPICTSFCFSSVMFLPGIMGTKLFEQGVFEGNATDLQRWSSFGDFDQERLSVDSNGYSINNIYTKPDTQGADGIADEIANQNIYKSFISDLQKMKETGAIQNYSLIPYDWRLPLDQIVSNGKEVNGKLYYGTTTNSLSDSFIIKELQKLADNSKSGKVTIIAHSNGGLVAKELIQTLKETNNPLYEKIDKVILVAVPQVGTPEAVLSLLHGTNIGPGGAVISAERVRDLLHNMQVGYNLLPSESYFGSVSPLIEFSGTTRELQKTTYGTTIDTYQEYINFLNGQEERITPEYTDTISPAKANQTLLNQAVATHQRLDRWLPASSTEVIQIAGWGIYTPSGIKYSDTKYCTLSDYSQLLYLNLNITPDVSCLLETKPTISEQLKLNGDGTVLSGSAHFMGTGEKVRSYWVDLKRYNESDIGIIVNRDHKDIFEVTPVRDFLKNLIENRTTISEFVLTSEPPVPTDIKKYTKYEIHSPLHLTITDNQGNITGYSTSTGKILEQIKSSEYLQSSDVKTVILPQDVPHKVILTAYASGSFTLESSTLQGEVELNKTVFEAIPTATSTIATLINTGTTVGNYTPLSLDFDGNQTTDQIITTQTGQTTVYDTTPPNLKLTFNPSTKDVTFGAIDNLDPNPTLTTGTSTISLTDNQDNTSTINFTKLKDSPTKLILKYNSISRNGVSTTTPSTHIIYDWKLDNQQNLKDLDTKVFIKGIERNTFSYKKQTNQTTIKTKDMTTGNIVTTIKTGFVPVTIITSKINLLDVGY